MNATKRKFNNLLQGLGRPSTDSQSAPSTPKKTSDVETLLQKRRRFGLPQSNSTSLSTLKKPALPPSTIKKPEPDKLLTKYCPTDRSELLRRLATFQELTDWTFKPDRVSEVEWAKRGWICKGKETVRCVLCHRELVVRLNRKEVGGKEVSVLVSSEIEGALVDKYVELIVSSHLDDCLWRKRGCDDTLLRLPLASTTTALQDLRQRYDELCSRKSFLPYEYNLRLPEGLDLDDILADLPPDFFKIPDVTEDSPPNRVALALALFGWQGLSNKKIGQVPNSASCHSCLRRLGLWMFKSKEVSDSGEILVPAPMDHLDPVREHRFFCPWKNADAQKRPGTKLADEKAQPGWKALLQTLKNDVHLRSMYAGQPLSARQVPSQPSTPVRISGTPAADTPGAESIKGDDGVEEDEKTEEARDKERWARLKRVKSLFDIKGKKRRAASRPGTSQSMRTTGEGTASDVTAGETTGDKNH